ncbi:hypothetical protein HY388_00545 [Candidatus Daviesbacteria bacterium]|nr:hypothetical protein [Candidatus Daviesbacteria bacterium]
MIRFVALFLSLAIIAVVGVARVTTVGTNIQGINPAPVEFLYPGILPDSPFYLIKEARHNLQGILIWGDEAKTTWYLKLADKKLAEARALLNKGNVDLAVQQIGLAAQYSKQAQAYFDRIVKSGRQVGRYAEMLRAQSGRLRSFVSGIKVPYQSTAVANTALQEAKNGLIKAEQILPLMPQVAPAATSNQ